MFGGASNVQLGGDPLKNYYPKLTVMHEFNHTVYILFNDVSKIPIATQIIQGHKSIYNFFVSGTFYQPHSIFKSKSYEFNNRNIGLLSGNDTRMV